ncbi:serine protease [Orenia metallireducens]|uniref:Serine protease n=1 Tax=Orenia metallireducens TaxID=1413210 RepID=A0A285GL42_9FIRM|nr:S8 family peptidase [Orenia metallireducens]SNY24282.1 serine protease [Orenia metallireducens]
MRSYCREIILLILLLLSLVIAGCSDSTDLGDDYGYIRGHITLANTPIESVATQSSVEKSKNNIKGLRGSTQKNNYVADEIIVSFSKSADIKKILKKYRLSVKKSIKRLGTKTLIGVAERDINALIKELNNEPEVAYAELNRIVSIMGIGVNDPDYSNQQWNYSAISLPKAWEISTGSTEVTVAVIDTGIDLDHPDLQGQLDLENSINILNSDPEKGIIDTNSDDDNGHGTHVAGIIGATTNNQEGIAGINWKVSIIPIKVLDYYGNGSIDNIAAGIEWAVDHGVDMINLSVGGDFDSQILKDAIDYAHDKEVTVIAASGNDGEEDYLRYPAAYENTIAVGSIDSSLDLSKFSNYGLELDFVAPGGGIYSTVPNGNYYDKYTDTSSSGYYAIFSGTSMATPHVTGVAALLLAQARAEGNNLTPEQLKEELRLTAQDLGDKGRDDQFGYGLINAHAALADARITKAKVFTGEEIDYLNYQIKLKSDIINVSENGTYELKNNDEGNYYVYCWIDLDQEGEEGYNKIDKGDYFAKTSSPVGSGSNTNLELNLITEDDFKELKVID